MGGAVAVMRVEVDRGERVATRPPAPRRAPRQPAPAPTLVQRQAESPTRPASPGLAAFTFPALRAPTGYALQAALRISTPSDPAEREASTIGARVARMALPSAALAAPAAHTGGRALGGVPALRVQREATPASDQPLPAAGREATSPATASRITSQVGTGEPLAQPALRLMEGKLRANFAAVRIHADARANELAKNIGARAFTVGADIFFAAGEYQPDSTKGEELLAHELVHTIQQGAVAQERAPGEAPTGGAPAAVPAPAPIVARSADATVQRAEDTTVRERADGRVQRSVVSEALDWFADAANLIPGFRMFTIILGLNPINMSRVDRSAANILRALIEFIPYGNLIVRALDSHGVFDRAGAAVEREINALGISGAMIRNAVMDFVNGLGVSDIFSLGDVWERAKRIFTDPISRIIQLAVNLGVMILRLVRDAILMPLARLAEGTRGYDLLKAVLGRDPITGASVPRNADTLIGGFMKLIGQEEIWNNLQRARAVPRAWAWFQGAVQGLLGFVRQIPQLFITALQTLEWTDIVLLPRAFLKVAGVFGGFIGQFLSWAGRAMWNLLQIIFEVVAPGAMPYLRRVGAAIREIFRNPLPFVGNLVNAAKLGFQLFARNIVTHLRTGLINWLTGSLPGVYIPQAFTLIEFGKFALSVFGISWQQIRAKIVRALGPHGETIMTALETTFDIIVALVRGGPAAAWDLIKERLNDLKDRIVDGIIGFVRDTIIQQAVPRLIAMFIPGAGFISAIISIYGTIRTLIDQISRIIQVVQTFLDGLMAIAAGNIQPAAQRVERVLASLLSLAISLLAGFVGLGRVADRVMGVINRVRASVDRALDTAVNFVVARARALFSHLFAAGRNAVQRVLQWWRTRKAFRANDGRSHELLFRGEGASARLMVKSDEQPFSDFIARVQTANDTIKTQAKTEAIPIAAQIDTQIRRPEPAAGAPGAGGQPDKASQINTLLDQLAQKTAVLFGGVAVPLSAQPIFGPQHSPSGFGTRMSINPLTRLHDPGSAPTQAANATYAALNQRRDSAGSTASYYIKGHLLNQQLGGRGTWENLTPLSRSGNAQHETQVESTVKRTVDLPGIVEYTVEPVYGRSGKDSLIAAINSGPDMPDVKRIKADIVAAEDYVPTALKLSASLLEAGPGPNQYQNKGTIISRELNNPIDRRADSYYLSTTPRPAPVNLNESAETPMAAVLGPTLAHEVATARRAATWTPWTTYQQVAAAVPGTTAAALQALAGRGLVRLQAS